jgi:hypothetical protein
MDKKLESVKTADNVTPVTEAWDEVSFEELEERLELGSCGKNSCSPNL